MSVFKFILLIIIGSSFSNSEPVKANIHSNNGIIIVIFVIIAMFIVALYFRFKKSKINYNDIPKKEIAKQKELDKIKEWSRRNKC